MDKYFSVLEGHTDIDGDSIRVSLLGLGERRKVSILLTW